MDDEPRKSRTKKKIEDRALQRLGERLTALAPDQLAHIDMPEALREAVVFSRGMTRHGAKRRQLQRIGALMRDCDSEPIRRALAAIKRGDDHAVLAFKKVESWRDELRAGNLDLVEKILGCCPDANRQRLTQLSRNANREFEAGAGVKASRALFRYLREIVDRGGKTQLG